MTPSDFTLDSAAVVADRLDAVAVAADRRTKPSAFTLDSAAVVAESPDAVAVAGIVGNARQRRRPAPSRSTAPRSWLNRLDAVAVAGIVGTLDSAAKILGPSNGAGGCRK